MVVGRLMEAKKQQRKLMEKFKNSVLDMLKWKCCVKAPCHDKLLGMHSIKGTVRREVWSSVS